MAQHERKNYDRSKDSEKKRNSAKKIQQPQYDQPKTEEFF